MRGLVSSPKCRESQPKHAATTGHHRDAAVPGGRAVWPRDVASTMGATHTRQPPWCARLAGRLGLPGTICSAAPPKSNQGFGLPLSPCHAIPKQLPLWNALPLWDGCDGQFSRPGKATGLEVTAANHHHKASWPCDPGKAAAGRHHHHRLRHQAFSSHTRNGLLGWPGLGLGSGPEDHHHRAPRKGGAESGWGGRACVRGGRKHAI
ncbi:hypothetical protein GGTG_01971 [Gaeumannomyces tritici R3-111a-1]|uniref:Uncharacterized protein n=1 Tax=Gaeumannomyces tritici (strain R3-111a-1) TaxID=644352 RepID=J3NL30_GAET3|nr:hypothetical protein GGTG_01971 [Gaeumannomyces tritici R3-111a-1]EJT81997.1 hypothetical protein GGTG_01971 [Gaeumannomyces tritici R3-111a-1]